MLTDHTGAVLFPHEASLRIIGRISWPLFACCPVIGFIRTGSLKKYAMKLVIFRIISEPFYLFAPDREFIMKAASGCADFGLILNGLRLNIFFTLLPGLLAMYGLREKNIFLL